MLLLDKRITDELYDITILGGGVAGLAAAISAGQLGLKVLVLEKAVLGGAVAVLETVTGYPGVENIGGWELTQTMVKQAANAGCKLFDLIEVTDVQKADGNIFVLQSSDGKRFKAKAVIVTTGGHPRMLGLENEERFARRGIHICAQCAGDRYSGKDVVVAGNGPWAVEASLHLLTLGCTVFFITGDKRMFGNTILIDKIFSHENFTFLPGCHVVQLHGTDCLSAIDVADLTTGDQKRLPVAAVFVYRGILPDAKIAGARQDAKGFFLVDENFMTSLAGVFATGRVVYADLPIQVLVGDGSRAAIAAASWLHVTEEYHD